MPQPHWQYVKSLSQQIFLYSC